MKNKFLLLVVCLAVAPSLGSYGQSSVCDNSTKLVCVYPFNAVVLSEKTFGGAAKLAALNASIPINAAIATQLTQLPVPSATVGTISIKRKGSEVPVPFNNLGPVLTDRPDTVGRGHIFAGFSYQHFNFNALDGIDLNSLPMAFTFSDPVGTPDPKIYYGSSQNNVAFKLDQYIWILTAGLTRTTDLSIIIPVNWIDVSVTSSNFQAYEYDIASTQYSNHSFQQLTSVSSHGSASGLGDITVGLKQMIVGQQHIRPAAAVGATFRFPTGDSFNYLGSGALGGSMYLLAEYRAQFAPHFKLSYQWNDNTKILDLQGGNATRLPGGLSYAVGTDFRVLRRLTLNGDFIGSQFVNTPNFTANTYQFNPAPSSGLNIPPAYTVVSALPNTYTSTNFSGGLKFSPHSGLIFFGNALIPINNVGLRSNVVPVVGIAYNFSRKGD